MEQVSVVPSRIEHVLFDFKCCVNELHSLKNELSIMDLDQVEQSLKVLSAAIHEEQRKQINTLYAVI
jgi:hypothetical protein